MGHIVSKAPLLQSFEQFVSWSIDDVFTLMKRFERLQTDFAFKGEK